LNKYFKHIVPVCSFNGENLSTSTETIPTYWATYTHYILRLYHTTYHEMQTFQWLIMGLLRYNNWGLGLWCLTRFFQQYFSYIVAVSFIGEWYRSTQRKPQICRKSLTNFITKGCDRVHLALAGFELTMLVVIGTACTGCFKSNYHTITTTTAPTIISFFTYRNTSLHVTTYETDSR
jgi:hypothetical protein